MAISHLILLRMRNVSDESCRENQNTLLCSITFLRKSCRLWDNVGGIWWSQRGHGWRQYKKGHVLCMLGNYGHRRARIWRTYFLFVLPRTNLNHINIFFWNNHFPMPRFEPRTPRIQNIHNHCTKVFLFTTFRLIIYSRYSVLLWYCSLISLLLIPLVSIKLSLSVNVLPRRRNIWCSFRTFNNQSEFAAPDIHKTCLRWSSPSRSVTTVVCPVSVKC